MTDNGTDFGIVILASGMSRRFGNTDKLLAEFRGQALAIASADLAKKMKCAARICVLKPNSPELATLYSSRDIETVINERPEDGQGNSLSLGIKSVADRGCRSAFVILADMPLVNQLHLEMLSDQIGDNEAAIAFDGTRRSPPALFRHSVFQSLIDQKGDRGARDLLRDSGRVKNVLMPLNVLFDIDTPEDIERLSGQFEE